MHVQAVALAKLFEAKSPLYRSIVHERPDRRAVAILGGDVKETAARSAMALLQNSSFVSIATAYDGVYSKVAPSGMTPHEQFAADDTFSSVAAATVRKSMTYRSTSNVGLTRLFGLIIGGILRVRPRFPQQQRMGALRNDRHPLKKLEAWSAATHVHSHRRRTACADRRVVGCDLRVITFTQVPDELLFERRMVRWLAH